MRQSRVAIAFLVLGCAGAFCADQKIIAPPGTKPGGANIVRVSYLTAHSKFRVTEAKRPPAGFPTILTPRCDSAWTISKSF